MSGCPEPEVTKDTVDDDLGLSGHGDGSDADQGPPPVDTGEGKVTSSTAPVDPRFPNANQTNYCYTMYCDYLRCQCLLGEDFEGCGFFKKVFESICPNAWIERFDDQRERGVFVGRIKANIQ